MLFLRIKIDSIMTSYGYIIGTKKQVRQWCIEMFESVPARRVWLYLKLTRNISNLNPDDFNLLRAPLDMDGPEDGVAKRERR